MEAGTTKDDKLYNFVKKTRTIIEQYERFDIEPKENYDVTLLLNACIGLLFVAHEKYNDSFKGIEKQPFFTNWQRFMNCVEECKCKKRITAGKIKKYYLEDEVPTIKVVCKHIRNSIAHCNFELLADKSHKIVDIKFMDCAKFDKQEQSTFKMKISVNEFKNFAMAVSDYILSRQSN